MPSTTEQDILTTQGQFTSAAQTGADEWCVTLDIGQQSFTINGYVESLDQANHVRRQLAFALLKFGEKSHMRDVCVNCRRKKRADW